MKKRITDKLSRAQKVERAPRMRAAVKSDVSDDVRKINEQACYPTGENIKQTCIPTHLLRSKIEKGTSNSPQNRQHFC